MPTKKTAKITSTEKKPRKRVVPKSLDTIEYALAPKHREEVLYPDNPRAELKRLVKMHAALTRAAVATHHMGSDRKKVDESGAITETIPCLLPAPQQDALKACSAGLSAEARRLAGTAMKDQYRQLPIYQTFLSHIYGFSSGVCVSYLCGTIDIRRAEKPSHLIRYCGLGIDSKTGALERRVSPPKYAWNGEYDPNRGGTYNAVMRTRIYQAFTTMWKNSRGTERTATSKYLDIWHNKKARVLLSERVKDGKISLLIPRVTKEGKRITEVSAQGFAHSVGWHTAASVFLYDLYLMWRSLEGLPVWLSYYEWARGREHNGPPIERENKPRMMTVDQVLKYINAPVILDGAPALDSFNPEEDLDESLADEAE
jgi:hypothetical protein